MMDYNQALKILELSPDFTEEELKSAYRRLSQKYHPDKHEKTPQYEDMIKKQQEINAAKDYLKKTKPQTKKTFDLNNYVKEKINKLRSVIEYNAFIDDEDFHISCDNIKKKISIFKTDVFNTFALSKRDVDELYAQCERFIKMELENFKSRFYKKHYVEEKEIQETINYNCSLKEFYDQLLKITNKYSKESKIKIRLEKEIEKYQSYAGYERLKLLIDVYKNNTLYDMKQNHFENIEDHIRKMHQRISIEVFEKYYSLSKKLLSLKTIIDNIDDESIKNTHQDILLSFEEGNSFIDTAEKIKKLEKSILDYYELNERKTKFKEIEPTIKIIYQSIVSRYCQMITRYNFATELEIVKDLNELFNQVLEVFTQACKELKDLEYFESFNEIKFEDINDDRRLLKEIILRLNVQKCRIYIKNSSFAWQDSRLFFWLDENDMTIYNATPNLLSIEPKKISTEELAEQYISLKDFLSRAIFVGEYKIDIFNRPLIVLYKLNRHILYYQNDQFRISFDKELKNTTYVEDTNFERFKDCEKVYMLIEEQIKKEAYTYEHEAPGKQYGFIDILDKNFKKNRPQTEVNTKKKI